MKKIILIICVILVLSGCREAPESSEVGDLQGDPPAPEEFGVEDTIIESVEPTVSKEPLYFDPLSLGLGKTFGEIAEEFPYLEYRGSSDNNTAMFSFPNAGRIYQFPGSEIGDPENPNPTATMIGLDAPAKTIFPNLTMRVRKAEIEEILDTKLPGKEIELYSGDVYKVFSYKGYVFLYWTCASSLGYPKDLPVDLLAEDIMPETPIYVFLEEAWSQ